MPGSILGNAVRRVEDPRLLRGDHRYVEDLPLEGALWAAFVRSPLPHARFTSVETSEAAGMPGVVAVLTAADLDLSPEMALRMFPDVMARPPLATDTVRFSGEPIAVVLAETRAQAADAVEVVFADYDPLDAVIDPLAAAEADGGLLFEAHGSNVAFEIPGEGGDDFFADADAVARGRFVNQRLAAVPLEVNGMAVAADPDTGGIRVWASTQAPHGLRDTLAGALGLDAEKVRVTAPDVGGGFGAKGGSYPEYTVLAKACLKLERPVRWTETRSENMTAMTHGRGQVQDVEIGATEDGTITGIRARIVQDAGAYPNMGAVLPFLTKQMGSGVYRIPKADISARSVVTNTTPTSAYRGAGRPEATALVERAIDMLAAELGMDPGEVRKRNFIPPEDFPHTTVTGAGYDSGEYEKVLDEAMRVAGYDELRREQRERRERGDVRQLGIGLCVYVEMTGGGPTTTEYASVDVTDAGTIEIRSGASAHGQGHHTAYAQLASELFGVPMDAVKVIQSDTAEVARGIGTFGSRSLQVGGSAIWKAGEAVVEKAKQVAAQLLEASPEDVALHPGGLGVAGAPDTTIAWSELAAAARDPEKLPEGMEPGLAAEHDFDQGTTSYPFGAHVSVIEVDTETGLVEPVRHIAVDDCGRIVNPMLVRGQQHGGIAQGMAQALYEEFAYDETGNPVTGNLAMYGIPSAAEFPAFEASNTETPSPLNPLGAKGIGESGTIGSTPAVNNAVVDALSHLGVRHVDMPLTPQRVFRAIQDAAGAS